MTEHNVVADGIYVLFSDGTGEHVDCTSWWICEGVLHTDGQKWFTGPMSYRSVRGPSFPLANVRRWEEGR